MQSLNNSKRVRKKKEENTAIAINDGVDNECLNVDDDKKKAKDQLQDERLMDYTCSFHICSKKEWFDMIEEKKREKVKLAIEKKMEVKGV